MVITWVFSIIHILEEPSFLGTYTINLDQLRLTDQIYNISNETRFLVYQKPYLFKNTLHCRNWCSQLVNDVKCLRLLLDWLLNSSWHSFWVSCHHTKMTHQKLSERKKTMQTRTRRKHPSSDPGNHWKIHRLGRCPPNSRSTSGLHKGRETQNEWLRYEWTNKPQRRREVFDVIDESRTSETKMQCIWINRAFDRLEKPVS